MEGLKAFETAVNALLEDTIVLVTTNEGTPYYSTQNVTLCKLWAAPIKEVQEWKQSVIDRLPLVMAYMELEPTLLASVEKQVAIHMGDYDLAYVERVEEIGQSAYRVTFKLGDYDGISRVTWEDSRYFDIVKDGNGSYVSREKVEEELQVYGYANEIMAAIGSFIEKHQAIPQDYLIFLTAEQRTMAEEYNRQTDKLRRNAASIALNVAGLINGYEKSYYDYDDADYQMIGQLVDTLTFLDYEKRIRENSPLAAYLSKRSDSLSRLEAMLKQNYEEIARYENIEFSSYCDLANQLYHSLNRSGTVPATAAAMETAKLVLARQLVPESMRSKLNSDTAEMLKEYNEQTAEMKERYYQSSDSLRYVLFYEKNRATQQWYREEFAQRLSAFALYENYSQLTWSDPVTSQMAAYEGGGSYGLWATYFRHEGERLEMPQNLLDYLSLVEDLLINLSQIA